MQTMLEIGHTFTCDTDGRGSDDYDDDECIETCIVLGYIYYEGDLFYTCLGTESEKQFDMYSLSSELRNKPDEDEDSF